MKKIKVISKHNFPTKLPLFNTITTGLALDYWNASQWILGAVGLLFLLWWIAVIIRLAEQESIDIFEDNPEFNKFRKLFKDKLKDKK